MIRRFEYGNRAALVAKGDDVILAPIREWEDIAVQKDDGYLGPAHGAQNVLVCLVSVRLGKRFEIAVGLAYQFILKSLSAGMTKSSMCSVRIDGASAPS